MWAVTSYLTMAENFSDSDSDNDNEIVCSVCRRGDNEENLLLCDDCPAAMHTNCIGLLGVPPGEWYCRACELDHAVSSVSIAIAPSASSSSAAHQLVQGTQAFIYERVSSSGQDNAEYGNHGLDTQNTAVLSFAVEKGLIIKGTWRDIASAYTGGLNPEYEKMQHQFTIASGVTRNVVMSNGKPIYRKPPVPFVVLVYSVSRFSRNMATTRTRLNYVHMCGGYVYSVTEKVSSYNNNSMFLQLAQQAENQSVALSKAIKDSVIRRINNGEHIGPAPYGKAVIRNQQGHRVLVTNSPEQAIINHIVNLSQQHFMAGGMPTNIQQSPMLSCGTIAFTLNSTGVLRRGKLWSAASVSAVIRRHHNQ